MKALAAGLLGALLAVGGLLEALHHHDTCEEGPAACCGHTCSSHHNNLEAPAVALCSQPQAWLPPASQPVTETLFSKQLFHPPAA